MKQLLPLRLILTVGAAVLLGAGSLSLSQVKPVQKPMVSKDKAQLSIAQSLPTDTSSSFADQGQQRTY